MRGIGFERVDRSYLYKRKVGVQDIEAFIEFNPYYRPINNVACDFGVSSKKAIDFANRCINKYGGPAYSYNWRPARFNARCQLGSFFNWGPRWSLKINELGMDGLVEKAIFDINRLLRNETAEIRDLASLYRLLLADEPWLPWLFCNGAIRAAECLSIGKTLGLDPRATLDVLSQHTADIKRGLGPSVDPRTYVDHVLSELA